MIFSHTHDFDCMKNHIKPVTTLIFHCFREKCRKNARLNNLYHKKRVILYIGFKNTIHLNQSFNNQLITITT